MTDLSTTISDASAEQPELSTQLDQGKPDPGNSQHKEPEEEAQKAKPENRLDTIKRAAADLEKDAPESKKDDDGETDDKPAKDEKSEAADDEQPEVKEETKEQKDEKARETEQRHKRQPIEPPAKLLPRAKELWPNTPHEVRADLARILKEAEDETTQARQSVAELESVKPFAEMAKRAGTTLDQALNRYVGMEQTFRTDPSSAFKGLLQNMNMQPAQAIGHILAAFGVPPERLAAHISQDPNAYTALANQTARRWSEERQQQQGDPRIDALQSELLAMKQAQIEAQTEASIIAPFASENPRYYELQDHIAVILESGILEKLYGKLSTQEKLAAAYDMAARNNPSAKEAPRSASSPDEAPESNASRAGQDFGGSKSVRGAPASGVDFATRRKGKMSRGEAINAAMNELGLAS